MVEVAPRWQAALVRRAGPINAEIKRAQAQGASVDDLRKALQTVGPVFERISDAAGNGWIGDEWAQRLALTTVYLVRKQQFGGKSLARWAVLHVFPAFGSAVRTTTPQVLPDLVRAVQTIKGHGDTYTFAQRLMNGVEAWPGVTTADVRKLGVIAAWRAGHVRMRSTAFGTAPDLPDSALGAVIGTEDAREVLTRNASDAHWWPDADGRSGLLREIGDFRGFGGPWLEQPKVLDGDGVQWQVEAGKQRWLVLADVHGSAIVADPAPAPVRRKPPAALGIPGMSSATRVGDIALVGMRDSYRLRLHRL